MQGFLFYYSCAYGKCSRFSGERSEPRGWGPSDGLGPSDCMKKKFRAYCYHPISEKLAWPSALSPPLLLMRGQLARTTSYDGLRSAARFLRRKAPGRHAAMLFDPPEQRCFHRSSNAERAAEQAGHLLQVTQSASSRLSSSAVQAGTTSRTTRGVVRPGLPLLRPHVQMETILYNMGVRQQSQLLLVVAVMRRPARVRMVRCSFTRASEHACPMPTHASPHIAPPQCGAGGAVDAHPMRPFEVMCLVRFVAISRPGLGF